MKQALRIILLFTAFLFCGQSVVAETVATGVTCEETAWIGAYDVKHDGTGNDIGQIEPVHYHHEAVLSDGRCANRICNSRPQRLLPSYGPLPYKLYGKTPYSSYYQNKVRTSICRCSLLAAMPFLLVPPCDYYVIALRHIIR